MVVGITIASIAAGFLIRLDAYTPTVEWATLVVVNRLGMGMAQQLPYTALQAVLEYVQIPSLISTKCAYANERNRPEDIATGNGKSIPSHTIIIQLR
jgi:hypothetical protein